MASEKDVLDHVIRGFHIPPRPAVLVALQELTNNPKIEASEVGHCISSDPGLSALILKTLNSPYYGMARTITDIVQATVLLGIARVTILVSAIKIRQAFRGKSCISLERFWDTASEIAFVMTYIGKNLNIDITPESLHVVGLFHDCGIPAMALKYPDYVETLKEANGSKDRSILEFEEEKYKCDHSVIGYYIANSWGLPRETCKVIEQHHFTDVLSRNVTNDFRIMYSCLAVACNIVEKKRTSEDSRDWPYVRDAVLKALAISASDYVTMDKEAGDIVQISSP